MFTYLESASLVEAISNKLLTWNANITKHWELWEQPWLVEIAMTWICSISTASLDHQPWEDYDILPKKGFHTLYRNFS